MTFLQKIKARIVDKFSGGVGTKDIRKQLDSLVSEDRDYALKHLPHHMVEAGRFEQLHQWLTDFDFIEAKVSALGVQALIEDYDLVFNPNVLLSEKKAETLRLLQGAIRLSAHVLDKDKTQLAGQLLGRLMSFEVLEIQTLLEQTKRGKNAYWLRPLTHSLIPPTGRLLRTLTGHEASIKDVAVTPDGKQVISGSSDKTIKVWDLETGQKIFTLKGHRESVNALTVTPDGKQVISGSSDKTIKVWDLETGQEIFTLKGHRESVNALVVTLDGKRVISGSRDCTLKVWSLETGKELFRLSGNADDETTLKIWSQELPDYDFHDPVYAVAATPDGKRVISGSDYSTIRVWDLETRKEVLTLKCDGAVVSTVAVTPDGKRLISGSGHIQIWNLETGEELLAFKGHTKSVRSLALTSDGKQLVSSYYDNTLKVWNLETKEELLTIKSDAIEVTSLAVTPSSKRLISGSTDKTIKVWNIETEEKNSSYISHTGSVNAVAITADGKRAISGSSDKTLKVWNVETREELFILTGHTSPVIAVTVTPDNKRVISGDTDSSLKVWDLLQRKEVFPLTGHNEYVQALVVTPDGKQLISSSGDKSLKVWNLETGKKIRTIKPHVYFQIPIGIRVYALSITPDGKRVIAGSYDNILQVWDLETAKELFVLTAHANKEGFQLSGHTSILSSVAVTPDGKRVISGSNDKTIKLWKLETDEEFFTFTGRTEYSLLTKWKHLQVEEELYTFTEHTDAVNAVAVTPDGKQFISASSDNTLKVWDLESRRLIASFSGESPLNCCAVAPDGVTIVAGEVSGRVHFLRLEGV